MQEKEERSNPIDQFGAVSNMKNTEGWKILMERYSKEGDALLTKILDTSFPNEMKYGLRDLYVFQLEALGVLSKVIGEIEAEAKNTNAGQSQPKHIGV